MNTSELEALLEARSESPSLEFKGAISWAVETFAKDLLAMANMPSGGRIIVGVDDATFNRQGLTPDQCESYKLDEMRDQMTRFADPHVHFDREQVRDKEGKEFIVIQIHPFQEVPVICRRNDQNAGTREAVIYYRGSHRRPESAPVANSYDMRTIVTLAASKTRKHLRDLGFTVARPDEKLFDDELEGL